MSDSENRILNARVEAALRAVSYQRDVAQKQAMDAAVELATAREQHAQLLEAYNQLKASVGTPDQPIAM